MSDMELIFLGTGSCMPSTARNVSAVGLRTDGRVWLFDCGEGTQHQLLRSSLKPGKVERVFVTHLHGDHLFGLPGLLCTIANGMGVAPDTPLEELPVLELIGPRGLRKFVRHSLSLSYSRLGCAYRVHELVFPEEESEFDWRGFDVEEDCKADVEDDVRLPQPPNELPGSRILQDDCGVWQMSHIWDDGFSIRAVPIAHTVPCVGYIMQEPSSPGKLDARSIIPRLMAHKEAFAAAGVRNPKALLGKLKKGEAIELPDGTSITPEEAVGAPQPGRKVVILGDTSDASSIIPVAADADVLVHEATNAKIPGEDDDKTYEQVASLAKEHGHSTPVMAGELAAAICARMLVLTHFSQRYRPVVDGAPSPVIAEIVRQAEEAMGSSSVVAAEDLMSVPIPRRK